MLVNRRVRFLTLDAVQQLQNGLNRHVHRPQLLSCTPTPCCIHIANMDMQDNHSMVCFHAC